MFELYYYSKFKATKKKLSQVFINNQILQYSSGEVNRITFKWAILKKNVATKFMILLWLQYTYKKLLYELIMNALLQQTNMFSLTYQLFLVLQPKSWKCS